MYEGNIQVPILELVDTIWGIEYIYFVANFTQANSFFYKQILRVIIAMNLGYLSTISFRYVSDSNLTTMVHMEGLFAKTFIPPDSLISILAGWLKALEARINASKC